MKKMTQFLKLSLVLGLIVGFMSCKKDNTVAFSVSETSFSLDPAGKEKKVITVTSEGDWKVEYSADATWLINVSSDGNSFTVGAEPNIGDTSRQGSIIVKSGNDEIIVTVSQLDATINFERISEFLNGVCSPSGVYVASLIQENSDVEVYIPVLLNTSTGEMKKHKEIGATISVSAVAENGDIFFSNTRFNGFRLDLDGVVHEIDILSNCVGGVVQGVSLDGTVWVGWGPGAEDFNYYSPVKWVNGVPELLPIPELNSVKERLQNGAMARGCSDDGSVIYGAEFDTTAAIYWKDGSVNFVAEETAKIVIIDEKPNYAGPTVDADPFMISPNGKYIAINYKDLVKSDNALDVVFRAGYFNTETKESLIYSKEGYLGTAMSDNGVLSLSQTISNGLPKKGYILPEGATATTELMTTSEWVKSFYGYEFSNDEIILHFSELGNLFGLYFDNRSPALLNWYMYIN